jgi:hypothetical protein
MHQQLCCLGVMVGHDNRNMFPAFCLENTVSWVAPCFCACGLHLASGLLLPTSQHHVAADISLAQVGLKVADLQEQSAVNRKQLSDATRDFKRNTAADADSEYGQAVKGLLKRYQEEIDGLTRRAKHSKLTCVWHKQKAVCAVSTILLYHTQPGSCVLTG